MTKPTKVLSKRDTTDSQNFQSVLCIPQHVSSLSRKREKNAEDSIADEIRGSVVRRETYLRILKSWLRRNNI